MCTCIQASKILNNAQHTVHYATLSCWMHTGVNGACNMLQEIELFPMSCNMLQAPLTPV